MQYEKPWLSYEEQLMLLQERGLTITDKERALAYLERIGYYRLSGYWYPFRQRTGICCLLRKEGRSKFKRGMTDKLVLDEFQPGAEFHQAVDLYVFDKKLRLLALDALERIEIGLRVDIAHTLGKQDKFAYLSPKRFSDKFAEDLNEKTGLTKHHHWIQKHAALINRSKEEFIKHHKNKYGLPVPIWIASEMWDFGTLSTLFSGMIPEEQNVIAKKYGIEKGAVFASWLRCLNYLRNVCAHHSRLWNRNMSEQPKRPDAGEAKNFELAWSHNHILARPFLMLCIAQHLLNTINPSSSWWQRLSEHLHTFPELSHLGLDLNSIGIIEGWGNWKWGGTKSYRK